MNSDIIIIGGGVMGLSSAWRLAQAGHRVTVLDKGKCGSGATTNALGALIPYHAGHTRPIAAVQHQSLWSYPAFAAELLTETGIDIGYTQCGRLHLIHSNQHLGNMQRQINLANANWPQMVQGQPNQQLLNAEQLLKLEPEVAPTEFGALYCRATAMVNPTQLNAALRAACQKYGVYIAEDSLAIEVLTNNNQVTGVHSSSGIYTAPKVIIAAGAWSAEFAALSPQIAANITPLKGQTLILKIEQVPVRHLVRGRGIYVAPVGNGRIAVGASKEPNTGFDLSQNEDEIDKLLYKAETLVPAVAEAKIEHKLVGLRPMCEQKYPLMEKLQNAPIGLYGCTGHGGSGLCMAPIVGKIMAEVLV